MARKRNPKGGVEPELPLTPMIDVVFQLLVFFLVAVRPMDVLAHLDVYRPAGTSATTAIPLVRIQVHPDGYVINGQRVAPAQLDPILRRLAELDRRQAVVIQCAGASAHESLVYVLNVCAKHQLTNLSVLSSD